MQSETVEMHFRKLHMLHGDYTDRQDKNTWWRGQKSGLGLIYGRRQMLSDQFADEEVAISPPFKNLCSKLIWTKD